MFTLALVLSLAASTLAVPVNDVRLDIGGATIVFPAEGDYLPVMRRYPGIEAKLGQIVPNGIHTVEAFFDAVTVDRMQHHLKPAGEFSFQIWTEAEGEGKPLSELEWGKKRWALLLAMPQDPTDDAGIAPEFAPMAAAAIASQTAGVRSPEHTWRQRAWSVSIEGAESSEIRMGERHITELADVVVADRLIMVLEVHGYLAEPFAVARAAARKRLDAVVDDLVRLNPSHLDLAALERMTDEQACLEGKAAPRTRIGACEATLQLSGLDERTFASASIGKARTFETLHEFDHALAALDVLIARQPRNAQAFALRGVIFNERHDPGRAMADFEAAPRLDPRDWRSFGNLGMAYRDKRDLANAERSFTRMIGLKPDEPKAWSGRCEVRALAGKDLDGASSDCRKAMAIGSNDSEAMAFSLRDLAVIAYLRKQYREAIADCDTSIARVPGYGTTYYIRGLAKLALGDVSGTEDIKRAKVLWPVVAEKYNAFGIGP